jgi:uncharacterized repeat protein (TIGR04076 family)
LGNAYKVLEGFVNKDVIEVVRHKVRVTVLKRFNPSEVFETSPVTPVSPLGACALFCDGQEFVVDEDEKMPEGFCTSAWYSIFPNVRILAYGGNLPWFREKGIAISCCTDGLRPVILKLERIQPARARHR